MTFTKAQLFTAHPSTPCEAVRALCARVGVSQAGFMLEYSLDADLSRLQIPQLQPGGRADELWKHTCFEAFVAAAPAAEGPAAQAHSGKPQHPAYYELNFSPSSQWAVYRFDGYRDAMATSQVFGEPRISVRGHGGRLQLEVTLTPRDMTPWLASPVRMGLAAVIETAGGGISYWALQHPAGKPDFHHPDGFVLAIQT